MDYVIAVTIEKTLFGKGDNSQKQLTCQNQSNYSNFHPLEISLG